ncbi:MAG TPA: 50S ribosomal protein L4 [Candidatus Saccharibacteria bacterium]|jgi:large subunit ribosomal protein L4|nr:50S ribosomal protein L4 [Candidatus Saccharibacteria bacterium]
MSDLTLPKNVFDVKVENYELIDLAYKAYLANGRSVSASTLKRGEVSGGGKKPWRQKGTGRARIGSIRAPHWRGGGVVFGPSGSENYKLNLTKKMKRGAIKQSLTLANRSKQVQVAELNLKNISTQDAAKQLDQLGAKGRILVVTAERDEKLEKSLANLPNVDFKTATHLNVFVVMNANSIIISPSSLSLISDWLGGNK